MCYGSIWCLLCAHGTSPRSWRLLAVLPVRLTVFAICFVPVQDCSFESLSIKTDFFFKWQIIVAVISVLTKHNSGKRGKLNLRGNRWNIFPLVALVFQNWCNSCYTQGTRSKEQTKTQALLAGCSQTHASHSACSNQRGKGSQHGAAEQQAGLCKYW